MCASKRQLIFKKVTEEVKKNGKEHMKTLVEENKGKLSKKEKQN